MNELEEAIFPAKWRPQIFDDLIFNDKQTLLNYLSKPQEMPSFIFYSYSPGTGKSSCAKIISKYLECDTLYLNSSEERGIDVIRERVKIFSESMSLNSSCKRMVYMDEADGITPTAQNSLRNLMEECDDNVFFVFTANDISKIITPIQSRCKLFNFEAPSKKEIADRLTFICDSEKIQYEPEDIIRLVNLQYPDIRSMLVVLQTSKINNKPLLVEEEEYHNFFNSILLHDINTIYSKAFSANFDILRFNRWLFKYLYDHINEFEHKQLTDICLCLAEIEKSWNLGSNLPIVFVANMLSVSNLFKKST